MGRPLGSKNKNPVSLRDRFYSKIIKDLEDGCWNIKPFKGHRYPSIQVNNNCIRANRLSYELHHGEIKENMHCLHKCDNPTCVNPEHLFLGTHKENMQDMIKKGRDKKDGPKGTRCAQHVLKENQVIEIIGLLKKSESQTLLASRYGVSQSAIWHIKANNTWKHIERKAL